MTKKIIEFIKDILCYSLYLIMGAIAMLIIGILWVVDRVFGNWKEMIQVTMAIYKDCESKRRARLRWRKSPKGRAWDRAYYQRPEVKERRRMAKT